MTQPDESPDLELVTAALRADSADAAVYARVLTESLGESLPPGCVTIERERSVSDRMRGRPGTVSRITVRLGERVMSLAVRAGQPSAEICREVRGVVLSRQPVAVQEWAAELARALVGYAEQNARAAEALRRLVTGTLAWGATTRPAWLPCCRGRSDQHSVASGWGSPRVLRRLGGR